MKREDQTMEMTLEYLMHDKIEQMWKAGLKKGESIGFRKGESSGVKKVPTTALSL